MNNLVKFIQNENSEYLFFYEDHCCGCLSFPIFDIDERCLEQI